MTPKFRVFEKDRKIMCEVEELGFGENGDLQKVHYYWEEYGEYLSTSEIDDVILMQYTGCRDKNGIEIYEGDVIKDKYDKTWLVQWYVGAFVITNKIPDSDGQTSTYSHFSNVSNHHFYFEVIGNIYENPELLEVIE